MNSQNYSTSFTVEQRPEEVFAAILNPRAWWSEAIEGQTDEQGDVFYYHYKDVHRCSMKITELLPNKKVFWRVLDNYFNFIQDQTEWRDTEITFEVSQKGAGSEIHFSHLGLVPDYECYEICSNAWGFYVNGSLRNLIATGKGQPNSDTHGNLEEERRLSNE